MHRTTLRVIDKLYNVRFGNHYAPLELISSKANCLVKVKASKKLGKVADDNGPLTKRVFTKSRLIVKKKHDIHVNNINK